MSEQDDIPEEPLPDLEAADLPDPPEPTAPDDLEAAGDIAPPEVQDLDDEGVTLGDDGEDAPFSNATTTAGPLPQLEEDEDDRTILNLKMRLNRLEELVNFINLPSRLPKVFLATQQTTGTWQETIPIAGTLTPQSSATGWRDCTSSADSSALIVGTSTAGTLSTVLEIQDGDVFRYVNVGGNGTVNNCTVAYLTQVGGANGDDGTATGTASFPTYTYNAYWDAAKTQLAGGTLTVQAHRDLQISVTAATLGLIQKNGTSSNYLLMSVLDEYRGRDSCSSQTTGMP